MYLNNNINCINTYNIFEQKGSAIEVDTRHKGDSCNNQDPPHCL